MDSLSDDDDVLEVVSDDAGYDVAVEEDVE